RAMQEQHRSYWKSVFADGVPLLHLPLDYKRPLIKDDKGGVVRFSLSREEVSALQALASRSQSTLFMVMLSLYNVLLSRVCNQDDIVVGTSVSGRYHADLEPLTGMFVNTLPLRHHPHGDQSFLSFLTTVRDRTLESFEHQSYPLEAMVEDLSPERDTSRSPLFDVMFGYENIDVTTLAIPGLKLEPYLHEEYASKFDLTLTVSERGDDLQLDFEYAASLFNSSTVHRLITYFKNIVRAVIADNEVLLSAIVMLPEAEEHTLLHVFNNTARSYGNTTFPDVFKDQAALYPHHIAATYRGVDTDYRTLHETSNRMAHYLHSIGLPAGAVVPLLLDRGVDLLSWIIGIQKAGGVFIALDTRHPADRIAGILDGCNPALVVTEEKYTGLLKAGCPMVLHETVATTAHDRSVSDWMSRKAADIAYAAYTSGSTGVPKGVLLHHGGMMNHFHGLKELLGLTSDDRFAQTAECSFDVYLVQMLLALTVGGCTHIIDRDVMLDAGLLSAELVAGDITILEVVPSVVRLLVNAAPLPLGKLRWVISTGEALSRELAVAWYRCYPDVRLLNLYGPAETSDDATYYIVPPDLQEQGVGNVPIGQPLPNFHIHVLDAARNLCPVGVSGEICIAGPGVGKGYIADVSLTASKFVPNPFASHDTSDAYAVMYRTGDVGYRDEQGMIYLTGRIDNMIKIRGARIETGDIEALLLQFAGIRDVLVLSRENKEQQYLAAYYIAEGEIDAAVLAAYLTGKLPEYMVPTAYVHLTAFPLTLSGKVNKRELPEPVFGSEAFQAPVTDEEILLAGIWCKILGMARVGTADNFFSLGGDSIKSIQIISRVRAAGYELSMKDIFANQTIAGLARCLKVLRAQPRQDIVKGEAALTPVQRFFFDGPAAGDAHFNQSVMLHFPQGITAGEVQQIFGYLQQHHDALRIVIKETAEGLRLDTKPEQPVSLTVYDAYNEAACTALQGSMDLTAGPLMKLGLFREKDGSHLLIVVHHLVTDGVSWRILLEDMATLYGQLQQKQTLSLPGKTTPFLSWSAHLHHYMESASFRSGRAYWQAQEKRGLQGFIPRDMPEGSNRGEEMRTVRFTLDSMRTHELLRQAPDTFRTSVEEVLLAAFVAAVAQQYGQQQVCVDLEGHGREEILPGVDISRTVGWFTSIYPVMLELKGTTWSDRLRHVKETLRTIPNKGIDYLLCRYYDNSLADAE
ncbi:amino acid adenylation domain-containing protein, partial [Chitinophaga eiseniae]